VYPGAGIPGLSPDIIHRRGTILEDVLIFINLRINTNVLGSTPAVKLFFSGQVRFLNGVISRRWIRRYSGMFQLDAEAGLHTFPFRKNTSYYLTF
jgi:hypothetical protein